MENHRAHGRRAGGSRYADPSFGWAAVASGWLGRVDRPNKRWGPLAPHVREAHAYQIALAARFPRVVNVNPTVKLNTDLIASDSRLAASQVLVYKNTLDIEQVLWRKKRYGTGKMQNKKKSSPTNPSKSTVKSIPELLHRKHKTFFTVPAIHPRTNRRKIGRLEIVKNDTYVHRSMQPST